MKRALLITGMGWLGRCMVELSPSLPTFPVFGPAEPNSCFSSRKECELNIWNAIAAAGEALVSVVARERLRTAATAFACRQPRSASAEPLRQGSPKGKHSLGGSCMRAARWCRVWDWGFSMRNHLEYRGPPVFTVAVLQCALRQGFQTLKRKFALTLDR